MAVSAILNFGTISTFDLDDTEGHVIPLFKDCSLDMGSRSNQRSKVKCDQNQEKIFTFTDSLYVVRCLPIPECQGLLRYIGRYVYVWYM